MAININHSNNTFCSNSGTFIFGTGITPSSGDTVYSKNFSGKYYGDASSLTNLPASSQFTDSLIEEFDQCGILLTKGSGAYYVNSNNLADSALSNYANVLQGTGNTLFKSDYATILNGQGNTFSTSDRSVLLNGFGNYVYGAQDSLIFGNNNTVQASDSIVFGSGNFNYNESSLVFGKNNYNQSSCSLIIGRCNTLQSSSNSDIYIIGTGICLDWAATKNSNTLYVNNLCAYDGKIFGDGSALTGLATGDFVTTGQTGNFGSLKLTECCSLVLASSSSDNGSHNLLLNPIYSTIQANASANLMVGGRENVISGGAYNNLMVGGCCNRIGEGVNNVAILGGCKIHALDSCTTYATNFCAYEGKFYGDGSALTGIGGGAVGSITNSGSFATLASGFCSTNVSIVAANCFGYSGYLLNNEQSCNLYPINTNYIGNSTFSAMIVGYNPLDKASMKIEGAILNGQVVSQAKTIFYRDLSTTDAFICVENNQLRVYVTGLNENGSKSYFSAKIDLLNINLPKP
jgi:hypothetical protein